MSLKNSQSPAPSPSASRDKPHLVPVTDPVEREAVLRELDTGELSAPIGGWYFGKLYAYADSLERWRKRQAVDSGASP